MVHVFTVRVHVIPEDQTDWDDRELIHETCVAIKHALEREVFGDNHEGGAPRLEVSYRQESGS